MSWMICVGSRREYLIWIDVKRGRCSIDCFGDYDKVKWVQLIEFAVVLVVEGLVVLEVVEVVTLVSNHLVSLHLITLAQRP
jgi:hypothetical protein